MATFVLTTPDGQAITSTSGLQVVTANAVPGTMIAGLELFVPPMAPDAGATVEEAASVVTVKFGDGYSQRTPKGINWIGASPTLNWSLLTNPQKDAILTFFRSKGGHIAFWYGLPGDGIRKYVCSKWSWREKAQTIWEISATFEQVFDLDVGA